MSACFTWLYPGTWGEAAEPLADGDRMVSLGSKHKSGRSISGVELCMCRALAVAAKCSTDTIPMPQRASRWEIYSPSSFLCEYPAPSWTLVVLSRDLLDIEELRRKSNGSSCSSAESAALGCPLCAPPGWLGELL